MKRFMTFVVLVYLAITLGAGAAAANAAEAANAAGAAYTAVAGPGCAPDGDLNFVCGLVNVEDFLPIAGGPWLLGSSYEAGSAGLYLIDTAAKTFKPVALSVAARPDPRYRCAPPDLTALMTHGLDVTPAAAGKVTVYAVNHSGRESIEVFHLDPARAAAEWAGCVVLPPGAVGNSVVALAHGAFAVTKFLDSTDKDGFQHILEGRINGVVYLWSPGKGFSEVPGTQFSGDNGIVASRDGKWLYVNAYGTHEIYRVPLSGSGSTVRAKVDFSPDNLRWAPDGQIFVTGQSVTVTAKNLASLHGWSAVRLDPETMRVTPVLKEPGSASFDNATSTVQIGNTLWFGTFRGDRIAYRAVP